MGWRKTNYQVGAASVILLVTSVAIIAGGLGFAYWRTTHHTASSRKQTTQSKPVTTKQAKPVEKEVPALIEYNPAVKVTSDSDLVQLTNAPASFKTFLSQSIIEDSNKAKARGTNCSLTLTVNKIYKQKFAAGSQSHTGDCAGGSAALWGINDGKWMQLSLTQTIGYPCTELEKYSVPSVIAGDICYDPSMPEGRPYSNDL